MKLIHTDHNDLNVYTDDSHPGHRYHVSKARSFFGHVNFQDGPVKEVGVNGLTNEVVLAIMIDRTQELDKLFPCIENKVALVHLKAALEYFEMRSNARIMQKVDGTNIPHVS